MAENSAEHHLNPNAKPQAPKYQTKEFEPKSEEIIDLNTADLEAIASLPGITYAHAEIALEVRKERSRFESVDEFAGLIGLTPAILQRIKPFVTVMPYGAQSSAPPLPPEPPPLPPPMPFSVPSIPTFEEESKPSVTAITGIDINHADRNTLLTCPGLTPALVDGILKERDARLGFQSREELLAYLALPPAEARLFTGAIVIHPYVLDEVDSARTIDS